MTKKELQKFNSAQALHMQDLIRSVIAQGTVTESFTKRLCYCKADVTCYEYQGNPAIYALKSYNTTVAYVLVNSGAMYGIDVLRYNFGYTPTSAQHIAKFFSHYLDYKARISGKEVYRLRYYA